jgi:hypothetical protein
MELCVLADRQDLIVRFYGRVGGGSDIRLQIRTGANVAAERSQTERPFEKSNRRWRARRSAVWFRHGGDRRDHAFAHGGVWVEPQSSGLHCRHRTDRDDHRCDVRGYPRSKMGRARDAPHPCCVLYFVGLGLRVCVELVRTSGRALPWGTWNWRILRFGSGLHRGIGPRKDSRPAGRPVSDQCRHWHFAGLFFQLLHRADGTWRGRMALAVRRRGASGGPFFW